MLRRHQNFVTNLDRVRTLIEKRRTERLKSETYAESSVFLTLPGPTENEVLAGMISRLGCGDRRELAVHVLDRLEAALRETAAVDAPTVKDKGIGALLATLVPETILAVYEELFAASLGEGHSVYEIIEQEGLETVAQELLDRADPLCDLSGRDIPQFNVSVHELTIVRLPPPTAPRDPAIRERLEAVFRRVCDCSILDSGPTEREAVAVVKFNLFWPIIIEAGNATLLDHYVRCEEIGHRPHLVGLFDLSPDGKPNPDYVELGKQLR
jgi:hypothetical protein